MKCNVADNIPQDSYGCEYFFLRLRVFFPFANQQISLSYVIKHIRRLSRVCVCSTWHRVIINIWFALCESSVCRGIFSVSRVSLRSSRLRPCGARVLPRRRGKKKSRRGETARSPRARARMDPRQTVVGGLSTSRESKSSSSISPPSVPRRFLMPVSWGQKRVYASRLPSRSSPRIHRPRLRGFSGLCRSLPRANATSSSSSRDHGAILNLFARPSEKQEEEEIIREENQILCAREDQTNSVYGDFFVINYYFLSFLFILLLSCSFRPAIKLELK